MARSLAFDREQALESAMHLFWRQGYNATSLPQLLGAMGISRSSLYPVFGDKRQLFIEALDLFCQRNNSIIEEAFDENNPLAAVRTFFVKTIKKSTKTRLSRGCMMINSILELADVEPELNKHATQCLAKMEKHFKHCFTVAQQLGQIDTRYSADHLAKIVMTLNQGLRVSSRKNSSREDMTRVVDTTLQLLGINE